MKKLLSILVGLTLTLSTYSQTNTDNYTTKPTSPNSKENLNELRFFYGDAIPLNLVETLSSSISDIFDGLNSEETNIGVFGLGYRYQFNRLRFGVDIGYIKGKTQVSFKINTPVDFEVNKDQFLVIPTIEFIYLKKGIAELYGSAGTGSLFTFSSYKAKTDAGLLHIKAIANDRSSDFAFQINPIGLRVGNNHIGGFIETGYGYKGIITMGISCRF